MLIYQESIIIIACTQNKYSINRQSRVPYLFFPLLQISYTNFQSDNQTGNHFLLNSIHRDEPSTVGTAPILEDMSMRERS